MPRLSLTKKLELTAKACEADLSTFIHTVAPHRLLGHIHEEVIEWWQREDAKDNQLLLLPRGHQKSALIAFRVAWELTKYPWETFMYISATSDLAEDQLFDIKNILTSPYYTRLWPKMVHPEEGRRARWNNKGIIVDHPLRQCENVRDASIRAAGIETNVTGKHAGRIILDDLVVPDNAYTEAGRKAVASGYSQLASIANPGSKEWVVGTRYHPSDIYSTMMEMVEQEFDLDGELEREEHVYEVFQRVVETEGEFLWPRQRRKDGRHFGFDRKELARKKAKYVDTTQFHAQYYNDPNDPENDQVDRSKFQYYKRESLAYREGAWWIGSKKLNIVAAMDFAFSTRPRADWTAIAVVGMDAEGYYYILDLDRFKTDRIKIYFDHLLPLYNKWHFRKARMEVSAGQKVIVNDLKTNYIQREGMSLAIDEYRPNRTDGSKQERRAATLHPRYDNQQIFHYRGGNIGPYEDDLVAAKPAHDDMMDVVMGCIDILKPPPRAAVRRQKNNVVYDSRFGGVSYRE